MSDEKREFEVGVVSGNVNGTDKLISIQAVEAQKLLPEDEMTDQIEWETDTVTYHAVEPFELPEDADKGDLCLHVLDKEYKFKLLRSKRVEWVDDNPFDDPTL